MGRKPAAVPPMNGRPDQQILPVASRRILYSCFWQWEHMEDGTVLLHIYPGNVVNGQPILAGEPVAILLGKEGQEGLRRDVERGFRTSPVQAVKMMPK